MSTCKHKNKMWRYSTPRIPSPGQLTEAVHWCPDCGAIEMKDRRGWYWRHPRRSKERGK